MEGKLKYLLIIFCAKLGLMAQKSDSLNFKLKKITVGVELGRSSQIRYYESFSHYGNYVLFSQKTLPYYSFNIGYNYNIFKNSYITPKIGFAGEFIEYTIKDGNDFPFSYTQSNSSYTNYIQGRTTERYNEITKIKNNYALLSLEYQNYYSPFKNEKIKFFISVGCFFRAIINTNTSITTSYTKDSLTTVTDYSTHVSNYYYLNLVNKNYSYNYGYRSKGLTPYLTFSGGLLLNNKYLQQRVGITLNVRLPFKYDTYFDSNTNFLQVRILYAINF